MTIILEQYTTPEKGTFEIHHTITIYISADDARRQVNRWVLDEVSSVMGAEEPTLVIDEKAVWKVPVILTASNVGRVGTAGYVEVDVETGEMNNSPECKKTILESARDLAATLPPYSPIAQEDVPVEYVAEATEFTKFESQKNPAEIIDTLRQGRSIE